MQLRNALLAAALLAPLTALADVTYSYTGEALNTGTSGYCATSTCEVTFDFTVSTALAASTTYGWETYSGSGNFTAIDLESWSVSDGRSKDSGTDNSASSIGDLANFIVETDSSGAIEYWDIYADWANPDDTYGQVVTYSVPNARFDETVSSGGDGIVYQSGTWTTAATPEPSSLLLLGTGLAGFAGMLKRRFAAGSRA
jgi:hypothetical protein